MEMKLNFLMTQSSTCIIVDNIRYEVYVNINKDASEDESVHDTAREYFSLMETGII